MALQAMKDSILNQVVLSAAITRETSHRDLGDPTFLEGPEGRNPVYIRFHFISLQFQCAYSGFPLNDCGNDAMFPPFSTL
jgi:hypothetical protein